MRRVAAAAAGAGHGLLAIAAATAASAVGANPRRLFGIGVLLRLVGYVTLTVRAAGFRFTPLRPAD